MCIYIYTHTMKDCTFRIMQTLEFFIKFLFLFVSPASLSCNRNITILDVCDHFLSLVVLKPDLLRRIP